MSSSSFTQANLKPVIKWVGGKRQLLQQLYDLMPANYNNYFEPFLGGGALFFSLAPTNAVVNDANAALIEMYEVIRDHPTELLNCLTVHAQKNSKEYYYTVREIDRNGQLGGLNKIQRVARLIFMLKVDFNGLYRVNSKGQFNVPYGRYKNPKIANAENIMTVSAYFNSAKITFLNEDFADAVNTAAKNDFVYFDPPYIPVSVTSSFTSYTADGFGMNDQERLRDLFFALQQKGVKVMLSNSDTELTRDLYQGANFHEVQASRSVNSDSSKRGKIGELIITSY